MGKRFARILKNKSCEVTFYVHNNKSTIDASFLTEISLNTLSRYDACFICSPTSTHTFYLEKCITAGINVFIEKPLSDSLTSLRTILQKRKSQQIIMVGYNLRAFSIINKIKELLPNLGNILYAHFDVGQYLPSWRPENYQKFYSAHYEAGGGVALDLIHELDLALELFPDLKYISNNSARLSNLKISVEDYAEFHFSNPFVRVTLDYLSHVKTRRYQIVGERATLVCDVMSQKLVVVDKFGREEVFTQKKLFDREASFETEVDIFLSRIHNTVAVEYSDRELGIDALKVALKARKKYV